MTAMLGVTKDKYGRTRYIYACRECGKSVNYKHKHKEDFPAICPECKKKNMRKQAQDSQKRHDDALKDEMILAFERALETRIATNKLPLMTKNQVIDIVKVVSLEMRGIEND